MRAASAAAVAAVFCLAGSALGAATPHVVVEAPRDLAATARAIQQLGRADFAPELELVGLAEFGPPVRVVLADESSRLARNVPTWLSGYALGPLSTVVLFPRRVPSYPDGNLEALLRHEITHILTYRAAGGRPVPRWFAEGLAIVGAREWGLEDRARYALAVIGRGPHSLRDLDEAFDGTDAQVNRAYALSGALLRAIQRDDGADAPARILAGVADGRPFDEAFDRATGTSLAAESGAFFGRDALWNTWVPFLTSSTALWMGVTLLALLAIRRRRQRDAEARARWEVEEDAAERAWADELRRERLENEDPRRFN